MSNENISRVEAEHLYDELIAAQVNGENVSLSQIQEAERVFEAAAKRENLESLRLDLSTLELDIVSVEEAQHDLIWNNQAGQKRIRDILHETDSLREESKVIEQAIEHNRRMIDRYETNKIDLKNKYFQTVGHIIFVESDEEN